MRARLHAGSATASGARADSAGRSSRTARQQAGSLRLPPKPMAASCFSAFCISPAPAPGIGYQRQDPKAVPVGSLGAVTVLLMWFYVGAYIVPAGAELEFAIEKARL
jgi:hypothetical protein